MLSRDETRAAERATGASQSERFALELEFVMSLANPRYVHRASSNPPDLRPFLPDLMPTLRLTRTNTSRPVNIRLTIPPRPTHPLLIADLASTGAMDDPAFIAYLEYLRYWEQPQYAKFVHYPHAFYFLEQLRRPEFRKAMANPRLAEQAHAHQFWHWQRSRTELAEAAAAAATQGAGGAADGG